MSTKIYSIDIFIIRLVLLAAMMLNAAGGNIPLEGELSKASLYTWCSSPQSPQVIRCHFLTLNANEVHSLDLTQPAVMDCCTFVNVYPEDIQSTDLVIDY